MRNLRILPQNTAACWLLVGSGVVIGRGGRAQVKVLYGKTYRLLSSLVFHSDQATFHRVTCPMPSLKEIAIHMSFFTALQCCLDIAQELTQLSTSSMCFIWGTLRTRSSCFSFHAYEQKWYPKALGEDASPHWEDPNTAFCVLVLGLGLLQLSKRIHYQVKKRKVRLLLAQRTSWQERSSTGRAQGLTMLF